QEKITETKAPITIMFEVPEALRGEGRDYSVIRVHDGETTVLPDLDKDVNTVTIETDKFSTYALAYSESAPAGDDPDKEPLIDPISPDESDPDSSDPGSSDPAPGESKPDESGDTSSDSSGSSDTDSTSSDDENPSINGNGINSGDGTSSSDENNPAPSESAPADNSGNPSTGIAISLVPLAAAIIALTVTAKRKKK
ncbi:MAG: hypothetical protein K2N38_10685, partial [Oscillospiraceae bacterium]|nr:hypothetical protein [Oscillospiraceae bacterium]